MFLGTAQMVPAVFRSQQSQEDLNSWRGGGCFDFTEQHGLRKKAWDFDDFEFKVFGPWVQDWCWMKGRNQECRFRA